MYAMAKICSNNHIITKTRRGFTQKLDNLERSAKSANNETSNSVQPKPIFNLTSSKAKETNHVHGTIAATATQTITPQHEELINYLNETWSKVIEEYQTSQDKTPETSSVAYFHCKSSVLPKFEPFDLESFWSQRFYQQIISS